MPYPFYNFPNNNFPSNPTIAGRVVSNDTEVMVNDVPMDGSIAVFPRSDLSEVYIKKWLPNGTISTSTYSRKEPLKVEEQTNTHIDDIKAKIGEFESRMAEIESRLAKVKGAKE